MAKIPKFLIAGVDRSLFLATLLLAGVGLIMVFSASAIVSEARFGSAYLFLRKQLLWDSAGVAAFLLCLRVDYHRWERWAYPLLGLAIAALTLVLAIGPRIKGARRWIHLGALSFQPSELAKLAVILSLAHHLDSHRSHIKDLWRGFLTPMGMMALVCGLVVAEPDLGSSMVLAAVCLILIFLSGARRMHLLSVLAAGAVPLYFLMFRVAYRRQRLMAFLNPWADARRAGYQVTQSVLAFGSGGLFGKGLGSSTLKLLYLPDPHTDFIFSIIGEELGLVGAITLIALFVFWGWRAWTAARRAPDLFGQLAASGITCWVLMQAAINMGVSCGIFPTKGMPLPFISFGGSSLVITLAAVGILLNISAHGNRERLRSYRRTARR